MSLADYAFSYRLRVRYAEVDAQAIVYNSHYLTYFDIALTEYFRALKVDLVTYEVQSGFDFHVVKASVEYRQPIRLDREVDIAVRPDRIGRSSLGFGLAIFPAEGSDVHATGEIVWVHADQASHASAPLPEELRTTLSKGVPR